MQKIEQKAIETYQKNLAYFQNHHPSTYRKVVTFEAAIASGQYNEKYSLEYKNDYFDVLELTSGEYLYGENSLIYSQSLVDAVDLKRTGNVFQGQVYVEFDSERPDIIDKSELSFHNVLWATAKIIEYSKLHAPKATTTMLAVYQSIFLKCGLGLHIPAILNKLKSKIAFIQEDNLEMFRLSLFVTDYAKLSKKAQLFFSILESKEQEGEIFLNFLETGNKYNLYTKYIPFNKDFKPKLQTLQLHILSQSHVMYGYSALLLRFIDSPRYIVQGYPFLNLSKRYDNTVFTQKPVLFLFSGPSTGKHIEWVQANHQRFITIAPLSACRLLNKYDITPNIVFHIDPGQEGTASLLDGLDHDKFFKNSFFIFSSNVDPETVKTFNKNPIYFIEQGTNYKQGFGNMSAPSVGEYSYAVAMLFGTADLYLLGLDLALDPQTLQSHSELHPAMTIGKKLNNETNLDYKTAIEYVSGNFLDKVPTLATYKFSINEFNRFTQMFKKENQHVYNLGNGAYLEGAEPLSIESKDWSTLEIIDQTAIKIGLKIFFDSISSCEFREADKNILRYHIQEAKKLLYKITLHKKKKYSSVEVYQDTITKLEADLSDVGNKTQSYLAEVYSRYFKTISSYVFDLFNTQELTNPLLHIKAIDTILVTQLEKMGNLFVEKIEEYLK